MNRIERIMINFSSGVAIQPRRSGFVPHSNQITTIEKCWHILFYWLTHFNDYHYGVVVTNVIQQIFKQFKA